MLEERSCSVMDQEPPIGMSPVATARASMKQTDDALRKLKRAEDAQHDTKES